MSITVGGLLRGSMRKIGVLSPGEPLPADEGADALEVFVQMVDAWTLEPLLIPVVGVVTHQLLANVSEYTIGIYPEPVPVPLPDSHIETARPEKILSAFLRDQQGTDYLIEAMDLAEYTRISRKTNAARPSRLYLRQGWPLNDLIFDSLPYADEVLHLTVLQPLSAILPAASLTEVINLPPGYEKVLSDNIAMELCPEWQVDVPPLVAVNAVEGKKRIKRSNSRDVVLVTDRAIANRDRGFGTYNISQGP
jgi:hypothetical protein